MGTWRKIRNIAGGGAVAVTLMACYGLPNRQPQQMPPPNPAAKCTDPSKDIDKDGYCESDCDEVNAKIFPGAPDAVGDGIDQNCDGKDG